MDASMLKKGNWLKTAVVQSNAPKESVIQIVLKNLGGAEKGRDRSVLHASEITRPNFCPKREAFLDAKGVKFGNHEFTSPAQEITYAMGRITAEQMMENWAGEAAVGNWWCQRCGASRSMTTKPKNGCSHTDAMGMGAGTVCQWKYQEVVFKSEVCGVSGSIDAFFDVGVNKLLVTELKTVNAEDFQEIVVPLPEHRIRTNLYLKIIAESNSPYKDRINLHQATVFYMSRGHGKKNVDHGGKIIPFKEYKVDRNDEDLKPLLQKAEQLKIYRETGAMPSGICSTALDKAAKSCNFCTSCFSGDHPSKQEPLCS